MIHKSVEEYLEWVEIIEWIALPKTNRKIFYKKRLLEYKWVFFLLSFDLWRKPPPIAIYVLTHWVNDYMWWHQTGQSHAKTKTKKKRYLNALKHKKIAHRRVERSVQVDNNVKRTESEKKKYQHLAQEQKKLYAIIHNRSASRLPDFYIRRRLKIFQTAALLSWPEKCYRKRCWRLEEVCCHFFFILNYI